MSVLKLTKTSQPSVANAHDFNMIGCWHSSLLLHSFTLICRLGLLGHHASKCAIDGPRVEGHAPMSPLHDRECVHAHICSKKFHAIHCLPSATVNCRFCRIFWPVGYQECRPTNNLWPICLISGRCPSPLADDVPTRSVLLTSVHISILGACENFQRSRAVQPEATVLWQQVSGGDEPSTHRPRTSRRGCGHLSSAFNLLIN